MADDTNVASKFSGIPIAELIAAPLTAACDSQKRLAQSAFEFMTEIGYSDAANQTPRLLSFQLERPVEGSASTQTVQVNAPFLGLVPLPSLDRSRMGRFVLFRPDGDRRERLIAKLRSDRVQFDDVSVMGVITATFECYSVGLVLQTCDNMQLWQVAFIEQHLAPTTFESYAEMLRIEPSLWEQFYWNRMPVRELRFDRWRPWKMNLFGL